MSTPTNPLGGGGAPPNGSGMLGTILGALSNRASTNPGQDFSQQSAQLQGADPSMVLRQLESINQMLGVLFVKTFQTLPNVAGQISKTITTLARAIKESQQASNVGEVVSNSEQSSGGSPPIGFSAVQQGVPPTGNEAPTGS